ncbi:hypothetical protein MKS88_002625 [Plasmodium brasilianum]|uniref:Uncharacterized protein n=1 Tax=Plasmodium brasilianum TaxID=5824 RepID=A0ACB9YAH8_PLABR|nr:hypothetical protein MKS88_002625 [Plasmodium brasilianum]
MMISTSVKSCSVKIILNNTSNVKVGRLLHGDTDVFSQKRYDALKEKAIKIVDENDYDFENRLNTLSQKDELKEHFKYNAYNKKVKKPSNSIKFKDNSEYTLDSLIYDDYHETVHKGLKESLRMKKYNSENTYILPKIYNFLKKLDKKYEREIVKLSDALFKRPNKYGYRKKISYKNVINVLSPLIISSVLLTLIFTFFNYSYTNPPFYFIFVLTIFYVSYKVIKNVKIFHINK